MEVHAHTHTPRKKWTHYFWEFLMLFLAVFCGFLAENQREHMVEHRREIQYVKSVINDLETDINQVNISSPIKERRIQAIDSVFLFFETHKTLQKIPAFVHRLMMLTASDRHFERNTITIDQLKNAGNMRLIRKKNITDAIASYDLQWDRLELFIQTYFTNQQINYGFIEKIINDPALFPFYRKNNSGSHSSVNLPDSFLIQINPALLPESINFLSRQKTVTIQENRALRNQEKKAIGLIELIRKEYHLK